MLLSPPPLLCPLPPTLSYPPTNPGCVVHTDSSLQAEVTWRLGELSLHHQENIHRYLCSLGVVFYSGCKTITLEKDCEVETLFIFESAFVERISPYLTEIDSKLLLPEFTLISGCLGAGYVVVVNFIVLQVVSTTK